MVNLGQATIILTIFLVLNATRKLRNYGKIANEHCFQFVPVVFSHNGQMHILLYRLTREQVREKLILFGWSKQSKIDSTKCISAASMMWNSPLINKIDHRQSAAAKKGSRHIRYVHISAFLDINYQFRSPGPSLLGTLYPQWTLVE